MADAGYRIAPIFLIRMAGVPFENLEKLGTTNTARAAREVVGAATRFSRSKDAVEALLDSRRHNLSKEQFRAWRKAIRQEVIPPAADPPVEPFLACWQAASTLAAVEKSLGEAIGPELTGARGELLHSAFAHLPKYLVFAAGSILDLLVHAPIDPPPPRNKSLRARERHLLLYLQRVCAKNDTLSEFGPHSWGTAAGATDSLKLAPLPGIARRETFPERWTAHGAAAAINADPETRMELAPRLDPNCRIEDQRAINTESGEEAPLDPATLALLIRCDGTTPAFSLEASPHILSTLAEQNLILWEMEVVALEPHAFDVLVDEVAHWRDSPVRTRWLEALQPLAALPKEFARRSEPLSRLEIVEEATRRLENLGAHKAATRFLYSATNPIGEECFRECNFSINQSLIDEVATEASPWIDLWRDNYAFVCSRVAAGLRGLLGQMPQRSGPVPLPSFLRHCAAQKMSLTGPGLVAFAHLAFQEVKDIFRARLGDRAGAAEYELTPQDCHFVRQNFAYDKFDEFTYPSADLQLAACSAEAVVHGEYQWILAELHPAAALLHHGFYWSCPDKSALSEALEQAICGKPYLHFGYLAADFTATTAVRFDALGRLTKFVAPQRSIGNWPSVSPAETDVFIDAENGDVGLRVRGSGEYLGSFARGWVTPLGFHPFSFSLGKDTPRLLCGNVVVQRRSWKVDLQELGSGDFTGVSRDLAVAVERLRAARDLPRYVYIRPTEQALRRSGVEGRDKDTKPVYIDLESYLFLEILHRWLVKAGELEVTEMLPSPDQLLWREPDGRRTFELRTQIVPR